MKKVNLIFLGLLCILAAAPVGYFTYLSVGLGVNGFYGEYSPAFGIVSGGALLLFGLVGLVKGLILGSDNVRHDLARIFLVFWLLASAIAILITSLRLILGRSNLSVEPKETYVVLAVTLVLNVVLLIWYKLFRR